jgi:polar amino acid transport system substrate-binding protein
MRGRSALLLAAVVGLAGACGSPGQSSPAIPGRVSAPQVMPANAAVATASSSDTPSDNSCHDGHPTASLAPEDPLPAPGHMPAGSYMATIATRKYLKVGVDQNTYLWGYRSTPAADPEGFDIGMVDQVAKAIFGPSYPSHIHYIIVPNQDRLTAVEKGEVDIVAETLTITCPRENQVSFSTEYFDAAQRVLVPDGSPIKSADDLADKRVCAASGSTSLTHLAALPYPPTLVAVTNQTDCLVMLEQGQVDAISTDDTILRGLGAQDPNLRIVPGLKLSDEPYGMAMSKSHPDFTRFVNGVLAKERSDGEWTAIWQHWLGPSSKPPAPPAPVYTNQS